MPYDTYNKTINKQFVDLNIDMKFNFQITNSNFQF